MKRYFLLTAFLISVTLVDGWFETCAYNYSVQTTGVLYVTSPNYPNRYLPGSSCKWYLTAPVGYTIDLRCWYDLDQPLTDCQSQRLYLSREGDKNLANSEYFCGYSNITRVSVGNEISVGYTSNSGGSGWIYCEARAVQTTQGNCQCGWNRAVSRSRKFNDAVLIRFHFIVENNRRRVCTA